MTGGRPKTWRAPWPQRPVEGSPRGEDLPAAAKRVEFRGPLAVRHQVLVVPLFIVISTESTNVALVGGGQDNLWSIERERKGWGLKATRKDVSVSSTRTV